jgi:2-oxoglutarate dehydrogenase E2 component (dihydrolipoamide succinyltransferase)
MTQTVKVPQLGESITEATIARWLKKEGEYVHADEPIAELETDKINLEVNAPVAGQLKQQKAKEGDTVKPGASIAVIDETAKAAPTPEKSEKKPAPAEEEVSDVEEETGSEEVGFDDTDSTAMASPAARKIAQDKGVALTSLQGSGKEGRITKEDVLKAAAGDQQKKSHSPLGKKGPGTTKRVKMSRLRQRIAERLKEAQSTAAILTTFNEIDMSVVMQARQKYKEAFIEKYGIKLGFMSFFTKAVIAALHQYPVINAEIEGDDILYKTFFNIGVAVGTDQGLVVPVIKNAEHMDYHEIEKSISAFAQNAQAGKLTLEDLSGGTFTISNGGTYGSLLSTPILNPPQSGILGLHKIEERPIAVNGEVVIRPMMYVALSYDHRLVDGKEAVGFLVAVKQFMEDPTRLLLNI